MSSETSRAHVVPSSVSYLLSLGGLIFPTYDFLVCFSVWQSVCNALCYSGVLLHVCDCWTLWGTSAYTYHTTSNMNRLVNTWCRFSGKSWISLAHNTRTWANPFSYSLCATAARNVADELTKFPQQVCSFPQPFGPLSWPMTVCM